MQVLLLTENWPPRVGGIEHYLTKIATRLPEKSVTVVAPKAPKSEIHGKGIRQIIRKRFFWPLIRPSWLPLYFSLKRWAQREKPDVMVCGKALFEGLIGYFLKKKLGIPYIVCTYAMEIETWAQNRHQRRKLIKVLKAADRITYINDITKQTLLRLGAKEKQLVKVWPGVDEKAFEQVDSARIETVLAKYKIKQPYILSVGRLIPRKGFDLLIRAFAELDQTKYPDYSLVIVGEGPEHRHLEESVDQQFMTNSVHLLGHIPDEDIRGLYAGAQLFVLTPLRTATDMEGFGIVFLEAAAQKVPAITTLGSGAAEAVMHKKTGLVVQPHEKAIAEAITHLLSHADERKEYGEEAQGRAYHEFRWSKRILLVKGMIDAILSEKVLQKKKHTARLQKY